MIINDGLSADMSRLQTSPDYIIFLSTNHNFAINTLHYIMCMYVYLHACYPKPIIMSNVHGDVAFHVPLHEKGGVKRCVSMMMSVSIHGDLIARVKGQKIVRYDFLHLFATIW